MSVDVTVETRVERPRDEVAGFAMDPANDTRWITALDSSRTLTEGELGVGTRVERVASFLGKRMDYVNEIVEYEPPARLAMRSVKAPFPLTVEYEFDDAGETATLARIHTAGEGGGFYSLTAPVLARMVRRGVERDLAELKRLMESEH